VAGALLLEDEAALVAAGPKGVGAVIDIGGKAEDEPALLRVAFDATLFDSVFPKELNGVGALTAIGENAVDVALAFFSSTAFVVRPPPKGCGALLDIGGKADVEDGAGANDPSNGVVLLVPPPKGCGALADVGGKADVEDGACASNAPNGVVLLVPPPKGCGALADIGGKAAVDDRVGANDSPNGVVLLVEAKEKPEDISVVPPNKLPCFFSEPNALKGLGAFRGIGGKLDTGDAAGAAEEAP
jgi:hypothetical protein